MSSIYFAKNTTGLDINTGTVVFAPAAHVILTSVFFQPTEDQGKLLCGLEDGTLVGLDEYSNQMSVSDAIVSVNQMVKRADTLISSSFCNNRNFIIDDIDEGSLFYYDPVRKQFVSVSPDKLLNITTGVRENAVIDTEYKSPNQHGGIYGTVIRKYHGVLPAGSLWFSGVAKLIDGSTNAIDTFNNQSTGSTGSVGSSIVYFDTDSPNGDILTASGFNIIDGWIDYVKL